MYTILITQNEGEVGLAALSGRRVSMAGATWATPACTQPHTAMIPQTARHCRQTQLLVSPESDWQRRDPVVSRGETRGDSCMQGKGRTSRVEERGGE